MLRLFTGHHQARAIYIYIYIYIYIFTHRANCYLKCLGTKSYILNAFLLLLLTETVLN